MGDIISNVFPSVQGRVDFKSFGHVVPQEAVRIIYSDPLVASKLTFAPSTSLSRRFCLRSCSVQVLGLIVPSGPNGHPFQFSFANRNSAQILNDLSQALLVIAESVPDGVRGIAVLLFGAK